MQGSFPDAAYLPSQVGPQINPEAQECSPAASSQVSRGLIPFEDNGLSLFLLDIKFDSREHKRKTYNSIRNFGIWQGVVLLFTGFFGGIFTGISGSGVDICSFSMLCLLFRVSEKVATPTSIVLMAINTSLGKKHLFLFTICHVQLMYIQPGFEPMSYW